MSSVRPAAAHQSREGASASRGRVPPGRENSDMPLVDPLRSFDGIGPQRSPSPGLTGPLAGDLRHQGPLRCAGISHGRGQSRLGATHGIAGRRHRPSGSCSGGRTTRGQVLHQRARLQPRRHQHPLRHPGQSTLPGPSARGSSSGSVSAVAAGLVDFASGHRHQRARSVFRSYCEVCGFCPSHGAVPLGNDARLLAPSRSSWPPEGDPPGARFLHSPR